MAFKRTESRYSETPAPVTPYQKAAQVWDERMGSSLAQAHNWRLLCLLSGLVSLILAGGIVWQSGQSRVTPYVVEVERSGAVVALGPALAAYSPSDAQIAWFLARFITNVRSLSIDPVLVRQNWFQAYDYASGHAAQFLNAAAQANDPFKGIGDRSVSVEVTSVVRASPTSFQVKWSEEEFSRGVSNGTRHWTAILTIRQTAPTREDTLRKNPLGLYVTDIAWTPDYGVVPSELAKIPRPSSSAAPLPEAPYEFRSQAEMPEVQALPLSPSSDPLQHQN